MAITSIGYPEQIGKTNVDWAMFQAAAGARFMVHGSGSVRVTPNTGGTRQVNISGGWCGGGGILDHSEGTSSVTLPTVASGTQYFVVGVKRNWNPGSVGSSFDYIASGSSSDVLPPIPFDAWGEDSANAGIDFQPLALVPLAAGSAVPGSPIDLRVVGSTSRGILHAYDTRALQYLNNHCQGMQVRIGNTTWTQSASQVWEPDREVIRSGPGYGNPLQVGSAGGGWVTVGELVSKATRDGNGMQLLLSARKTGGAINFGTNGGVVSTDVAVINVGHTAWRPVHDIPGVGFEYVSANNTTFGGTARYTTNGNLIIISGTPNTSIRSKSTGDGWSIRAQIRWTRES